jgi:lipid-binding SYLF domain-containing protein
MKQSAVDALSANKGLEVGVGPSVVVIDSGMAKTTTTTTMKDDIYAFVFSQKGLMAGLGLTGNQIARLPD